MQDLNGLIQNSSGWLFVPSAIALGALHGLEPGHSKTMMAAFIVAIRGTMRQAILLALSATISHTAVVWIIALLGMKYGEQWGGEATEPYFKLVSGALLIGVALWVMARTYREHIKHLPGHEHDDAHERKHAAQLRKALTGKPISNGQIMVFGLTGGLLPCPAAITVLILCLELNKYSLGIALVACFSIGLALTLVASGTVAAWGVHHAKKRWIGFEKFLANAPYVSSLLIMGIGFYTGWQGWQELFP